MRGSTVEVKASLLQPESVRRCGTGSTTEGCHRTLPVDGDVMLVWSGVAMS